MPSLAQRLLAPALVALAAPALAGCFAPTAGRRGQLAFEYAAPDDLFGRASVATPIARGARVNLDVFAAKPKGLFALGDAARDPAAGGELLGRKLPEHPPRSSVEEAPVFEATSARPEVAEILGVHRSLVELHGRAPGQAEITVRTGAASDVITVAVAEIDHAEIDHWVKLLFLGERFTTDAAFVKGGTGRFLITTRDAAGRALLGLGDAPPLAIEPAGAGTITHAPDDLRHLDVRFDAPGDVTLRAKGGQALRVAVIDASAIRAIELVEPESNDADTARATAKPERKDEHVGLVPLRREEAGRDLAAMVRGTLDGGRKVLLLGDVVTVTMTPATICAPLPPVTTRAVRSLFGDGIHAARVAAPGTCTVEAHLAGLSARVDVAVTPRR